MTERKLTILVLEPNGTQSQYNSTTKENAHNVARQIGKEGYFAQAEKGKSNFYPPSRILLITIET